MTPHERPGTDAGRHPRLASASLVAAGGTVGTAARYPLGRAIGDAGGVPVGIVAVNLTGALLIGVLVELLASRIPDPHRRHRLRLLFGTGVLGGYTTYSAFALGAAELVRDGRPAMALAYGLGTVLVGAAATGAGIWLARTIARPR